MSITQKFLLCLMLCFGGGWLTGLATQEGVKVWYPHLIKPSVTPPDLVFPIVWSILYVLMAIALTLLWISPTNGKTFALRCFSIQLLLNFAWSGLFFYLHSPTLALGDIVLLWIAICLTFVAFWRHTRLGSCLLFPYLAWVSYALYLNLFIWIYN